MIRRTITIEIHEGHDFTVRDGGLYCPQLTWDEMLGTVAELTHSRIGAARYRMDDATGWAGRERLHQQRMAELRGESA